MKIFITGSSGYIGGYLHRYLRDRFEVIPSDLKKTGKEGERFELLDILDAAYVINRLKFLRPDFVIHLAGVKELNLCQQNKKMAYDINVRGTENIAKACNVAESPLIFLSTDYVFDGEKGMYKEEEVVNPRTYYGITKLEGENIIRENLTDYVIIRTGGVFGSYDGVMSPLFLWLLENLKAGKTVEAFTDIYNSPTPLEILAEGMHEIIQSKGSGLFHIAGPQRINRFDFFRRIARHFGLKEDLIRPVKNKDIEQPFPRPGDISLDTKKSRELFNIPKGDTLTL